MVKHTITINHHGEERVDYFLDDCCIASVNHDDHGWAGMELADGIIDNFIEAFNLTVVETHEEGEEE